MRRAVGADDGDDLVTADHGLRGLHGSLRFLQSHPDDQLDRTAQQAPAPVDFVHRDHRSVQIGPDARDQKANSYRVGFPEGGRRRAVVTRGQEHGPEAGNEKQSHGSLGSSRRSRELTGAPSIGRLSPPVQGCIVFTGFPQGAGAGRPEMPSDPQSASSSAASQEAFPTRIAEPDVTRRVAPGGRGRSRFNNTGWSHPGSRSRVRSCRSNASPSLRWRGRGHRRVSALGHRAHRSATSPSGF